MDKCLQPHAHHCRQFASEFEIIEFLRLFQRFLSSNVTICRFLVAISRLIVLQSSMIFQGEMITYMRQ